MQNTDVNYETIITYIGKQKLVHTSTVLAETFKKKNMTFAERRKVCPTSRE